MGEERSPMMVAITSPDEESRHRSRYRGVEPTEAVWKSVPKAAGLADLANAKLPATSSPSAVLPPIAPAPHTMSPPLAKRGNRQSGCK